METVKSGSEKEESKDLSGVIKILVTDSIATEFKSISIIEAMGSEHNEGTSFPPSKPRLCVNGCGFFGMASNTNLCSKCYRDLRAGEEQAVQVKATMEKSLRVKTKKEDFKSMDTSAHDMFRLLTPPRALISLLQDEASAASFT
ncbi:hypothetical protein V6N13_074844 [Hibiscus sabdariffa]